MVTPSIRELKLPRGGGEEFLGGNVPLGPWNPLSHNDGNENGKKQNAS